VLRGGSWNNNQNNARCAYRNRNNPDNRNNNVGFRVAASHGIPCPAGNATGPRTRGRGHQGELARPVPGWGQPQANIEGPRPLW